MQMNRSKLLDFSDSHALNLGLARLFTLAARVSLPELTWLIRATPSSSCVSISPSIRYGGCSLRALTRDSQERWLLQAARLDKPLAS